MKTKLEKKSSYSVKAVVKLADELRTTLLGQIPLGKPDWTEEDFAPSIYAADHPTGKIYLQIAQGIIDALAK